MNLNIRTNISEVHKTSVMIERTFESGVKCSRCFLGFYSYKFHNMWQASMFESLSAVKILRLRFLLWNRHRNFIESRTLDFRKEYDNVFLFFYENCLKIDDFAFPKSDLIAFFYGIYLKIALNRGVFVSEKCYGWIISIYIYNYIRV
jgi:hypothetical protein